MAKGKTARIAVPRTPARAKAKRRPRPPAPERIVGISAIAERLKLTPRRVQQMVSEGLPRLGRGKYDLDQVLDWYIARLELQLAGGVADDVDGSSYARERKREKAAAADLKELTVAQRRRELVAIADVEQAMTDLVVTTKAAVLAVAPRIAPKLVGLEALAIQDALGEELKQALSKLSERG